MTRYLCHDEPLLFDFDAQALACRADAILMSRSAFHPGGGGQLHDRGIISWGGGAQRVVGIDQQSDGLAWHYLDGSACETGTAVRGSVDRAFRSLMSQLHTDLHILNALVFQRFDGALVTGAQIAADGTARHDFDLPEVDNAKLKALEADVNDVIAQGLEVRTYYVTVEQVMAEPGLIRSKSVAPPPTPDGKIRIVEIVGLDRQACGGTHVANTRESRPIRLVKVDNKGRHNRRVYIALEPAH
ncbi:MAG TPA: alanyl-tRNA editing protein [Gemmatimonadales bacterium]|jgi:misacylated tRNA(Ala) deacylase|nr:alanyl-tRNA editing protein [Gemmatimonadales bacterium]